MVIVLNELKESHTFFDVLGSSILIKYGLARHTVPPTAGPLPESCFQRGAFQVALEVTAMDWLIYRCNCECVSWPSTVCCEYKLINGTHWCMSEWAEPGRRMVGHQDGSPRQSDARRGHGHMIPSPHDLFCSCYISTRPRTPRDNLYSLVRRFVCSGKFDSSIR